ncbi:MAG: peptidoglycan -binding protein [Alphaproteobacteria bacterium]|nr:MAG: peptidoglycan -binding protein [Alphaproteobacteria bacterium]
MPAFNRQRGRRSNADHWPGFVDALSSMLLVIVFLLSLFVLAQVFLSQTLSGQDEEMDRLNDTIAQLQRTLAMEREDASNMRLNLAQLSASLQSANLTREKLEARTVQLEGGLQTALGDIEDSTRQAAQIADLQATLSDRQQKLTGAQDQLKLLNQQIAALRQQLARLEAALIASEQRDKEQQAVISNLGRRLNVALAQRVQELAGYRSEFFGKLREAIGNHPGIQIVGDRFVMQSEVLFGSASAQLNPQGANELTKLATTLSTVIQRIPAEIDWVLRVDGHTDPVPISTSQFPSNWELSTARATAVVRYLISQGIPPNRLAATGFGEFAPIINDVNTEANRRNRRIEFKLTQR